MSNPKCTTCSEPLIELGMVYFCTFCNTEINIILSEVWEDDEDIVAKNNYRDNLIDRFNRGW